MKQIVGGMVTLLLLVAAHPAAAQQAPGGPVARAGAAIEQAIEQSGIVPALETLAAAATPELQRALDQLTASLNALATRIASDPELRSSAVRAARGAADVGEAVIIEQSGALQEALRTLADRIEALAAPRERRD
jgi:hypothetical protein